MKISSNLGAFCVLVAGIGDLPAQQTPTPAPTAYVASGRTQNSTIWTRTVYQNSPSGQAVAKQESYTELASGLNYFDTSAEEWKPSEEKIDILPDDSAAATNGTCQAFFPENLNNGTIRLVTPDGLQLRSQPIGLSYDDGTNIVLIAELKDSTCQLVGDNEVIYTNAFTGIDADVLYKYTKAGLEQDILLNSQPQSPEAYGLNMEATRIQILTEFFNPPQPLVCTQSLPQQGGWTLTDETLGFGAMEMIEGRAFLLGGTGAEPQAFVSKQWLSVDGRQFLVEQVPLAAIASDLSQLPASQSAATQAGSPLEVVSIKRLLPPAHAARKVKRRSTRIARAALPRRGMLLDYQIINSSSFGITFRSDMTYYISGQFSLFDTNTLEGGAVLKYATNAELVVEGGGGINLVSSAFRPVIFTGKDDDSVGQAISGSTGNPTNYYANPAIFINNSVSGLENFRIAHARCGIIDGIESTFGLTNGQIINCAFGVGVNGQDYMGLNLRNMLFANVRTNLNLLGVGEPGVNAQNTTFANSGALLSQNFITGAGIMFVNMANCIMAGVTNSGLPSKVSLSCEGSNNGFYESFSGQLFGSNYKSTTSYPFQAAGAGGFYLTNGCVFRGAGTTNIDPALLAELPEKTTTAPIVYDDTNISLLSTLGPVAPRDTNSSPDMGFHFDPLDYAFGGCNLSNLLTIASGTAIGWFEDSGGALAGAYGISLGDGADLSFSGTATQPCIIARYAMVQDGGNGQWTNNGLGGFIFSGTGNPPVPQLSARFTRWTTDYMTNLFGGNSPFGLANFWDSEFYDADLSLEVSSVNFTNCLFFRDLVDFGDSETNISFTIQNCAFYNGGLALSRSSAFPDSSWLAKNTSFDGTSFSTNDYFSGNTNYTFFDFNAYNTNNLAWTNYGNWAPPSTGTLEIAGFHDCRVTNYNWQSSWFGDFYLPPNSPLIQAGSTNANDLGLYHFTSETNQTIEGNSIVNIGYAYVATDPYGNPNSTPGDGVPDYLADANGNGIDDPGETPWDIGFLSEPQSASVPQGATNVTFSCSVGGTGPFFYQWLLNSNPIAGATSSSYTIPVVSPTDGQAYSVMVSNLDGHVTSTNAILWVSTPVALSTGEPQSQTVVQGSNVTFTVTATAGDHLVYQWYYGSGSPLSNGSGVTGATSNVLAISDVQVSDAGNYYAVVTNLFNSATSVVAALTVVTNPVILPVSWPTNAIQSEDVPFTVTAGEPYYQWYFSNAISGSYPITYATSASWTLLVVQTTNAGLYTVVVTNLAGSTSASSNLTVQVPPWITQQPPLSIVTNQGSNVTFTVAAIGTTNLSYQWYENGTNPISGATSNSFTLTNIQGTNAGGYSAYVSNVAGSVMSAWAWLSVNVNGTITNGQGGTGGGSPSNPAPVIFMTTPPTNALATNPAVHPYGQATSIRAQASSFSGYVTNVIFYAQTNLGPANFKFAGNAVPGPNGQFALAWNATAPGTNILEAVARDYDGQSTTSSWVYVVMTIAPGFTPAPGTNLVWTEGAAALTNSFAAVVTNDGQPFTAVTNMTWTSSPATVIFSAPHSLATQAIFPTNANYTLSLSVDNAYATNVQPTHVTIKRRPQVYFDTPANGSAFFTGSNLLLQASAVPYDGNITNVTFYDSNGVVSVIGPAIQGVGNTWSFWWTNAPPWTNLISAVAYCDDGLTNTDTISVAMNPKLAVQFLAPTNNQLFIFSPTNILLEAQAVSYISNAQITSVTFSNVTQGISLGAGTLVTNGVYQLWWQYVTNGEYNISVTARDDYGNVVTTNVASLIVNAMPQVSIVNPITNLQSFLEVTNVLIQATASDSDGTIASVQFYTCSNSLSASNLLATVTNLDTNGDYEATWTNLAAGVYSVVAVATDNRGASTVSAPRLFSVTPTNSPPFVEITSPSNDEVFPDGSDITITANAYETNSPAQITNLEFYVDGESIGNSTEPPYAITECCWKAGTYQIMAIATDNLGSSTMSSNVEITVVQGLSPQGFWDTTFYPPDVCGPNNWAIIGKASSTYGSNYYLATSFLQVNDASDPSFLFQWNDTNWFQWLPSGQNYNGCNSPVLPVYDIESVAVDSSGTYVAGFKDDPQGGYFTPSAYDYYVFRMNGTNAIQIGDAFTNYTLSDNFWPDGNEGGTGYKNPQLQFIDANLYLYGDFKYGLDTNVQFVARWNTNTATWEKVGDSLNGPVFSMASFGGNLVIGGAFTNADGNTNACDVAELVNGRWTNLGAGISGADNSIYEGNPYYPAIPGAVFSIAVCGTNLFAGGDFTTAGGLTNANGVAVWDGLNWHAIAGGLTASNYDLYGGDPGFSIASDYLNPAVYCLATHGSDTIYVGGDLSGAINADGSQIAAGGIAEATWSEAAQQWVWSPMDLGFYIPEGQNSFVANPINTLSIMEGTSPGSYDVVVSGLVGGEYVGAAGMPFSGVARWRVGYPPVPSVPTVSITTPANGSTFATLSLESTNVNLTWTASSSYTNLDQYYIYVDGQQGPNDGLSGRSATVTNSWMIGPGTNDFNVNGDPPPLSVGPHTLTVVLQDTGGLVGSASVSIDVINATNTAIAAGNDSYTIPANNPGVVLLVLTNDIPASGLKISEIQGILGNGSQAPHTGLGTIDVSYDQTYLTYTPFRNVYGTDQFYYYVTNSTGQMSEAIVTVNILPLPYAAITSPANGAIIPTTDLPLAITGTNAAVGVGNSVTNVELLAAFGTNLVSTNLVPANGTFAYNWTNTAPGYYTFVAIATDSNGMTNASAPVTVSIYNPNAPPDVLTALISNLNPTNNIIGQTDPIITQGLFDLQGIASNSVVGDGVSYQVLLYPATSDLSGAPLANVTPGPLDAQGFHDGGDNHGDLGTLDLTTIQNGVYQLVLVVRGGAAETETNVQVQLNTPLKIGEFTFSEQDLTLPVNGIPVTVTRTYNSENPNSADFGYGWTFALNDMNVQLDETRQNVLVGGDQAPMDSDDRDGQTISVRTGGGWDVTLTLPNGQQTTFAFSAQYNASGMSYQPVWTAPPWIHATLTPLPPPYESGPDPDVIDANSAIYWADSDTSYSAPIANQDFPGWILTTSDGTKYIITRPYEDELFMSLDSGSYSTAQVYGPPTLSEIVTPSTNAIIINPNEIYHQDPNGNTNAVVNITRDGNGRITDIFDPDATNGLPLVQYIYNQDTGNLIQVIRLLDRNTGQCATNHYDYNNPNFPHYITSIENADGVPVTRNFYDSSGRLIQTEDANGNSTYYFHNLTNSTEVVVDPLGRTNTYAYDPNGNVIAQTNALNQVTLMAYDQYNDKTNEITFLNGQAFTNSYSYDDAGDLLSSTDPLGHTTTHAYNEYGEPTNTVDADSNSTTNYYDSGGNLIATSDAMGNRTVNTYEDGLLATSTDPIGTVTTNAYDTSGNLIASAMLDVSGNILSSNTYTYDDNGNRLTLTVWRHVGIHWEGDTTTNFYDAQNRVTETVAPDSGINQTIYNLIGQQAETIDPLGHTNSFAYDALGHLTETTYPDGTTTSSAYDAAGNRTNSVDQLSRTTQYIYDALNRLTETIYPDGSSNVTVYDDLGRVAQTMDARGTITANAYDAAGRRIAVTNAFNVSGVASTNFYTYDPDGNQITFTDADGHTTTNVYDALNRQVQVVYPDGTTSETVYDPDGRSIIQTNQDRFATWFGYDGAGRLTAMTNALQQVTRYQYDEAGNEILQVDALNRTNIFGYDSMNRKIAHTMPGGQSEGFGYDFDGNQVLETNFDGAVITNLYDSMNRLTNVSSLFGYNVSYAYSATGQRTNMVDPSGTTAYAYDLRDRLVQKSEQWNGGPNITLNYLYDLNGNLTNLWSNTPGGVTNVYQYDALNRLTNVIGQSGSLAQYRYDLAGNLQSMRYGNGVTNLFQYDGLNRLTNSLWNSNALTLCSFSYELGATGNRTNLNETVAGTNRIYSWQYDHLYRLTNENVSSSFQPSGALAYQLDAVGNRTNRTAAFGLPSQTLIYNPNDWLTNTDKYDSNGNTTNSGSSVFQYDVMNHLTNAWVNGVQVLMTYDGDGDRVSKTVGTVTTYYLLDSQNPSGYSQILEEWTNTAMAKVYNYGLDLINQRQPGISTNYFVFDGHGSTRMLADIGGTVVNFFVFDAFGNLIASNAAPQTAYLYCGQQWDPDLGLYLNRARYLNPNTGRFWTMDGDYGNNEDPLSLHKYLYAEDDPVDNDDPLGLYSQDEGYAMERLIGADYGEAHPMATVSYGQEAGIGKNPLLKPDILNKTDKTFADIKPLSLAGIRKGITQLRTYSRSLRGLGYTRELWPLNSFAPVRTVFYNYNPYFYFNVDGIIFYTRIDPGTAFLPISIPGLRKLAAEQAVKLAAGEATTFETVVSVQVVGVETAETTGLGADVGVAVGDSVMGAP